MIITLNRLCVESGVWICCMKNAIINWSQLSIDLPTKQLARHVVVVVVLGSNSISRSLLGHDSYLLSHLIVFLLGSDLNLCINQGGEMKLKVPLCSLSYPPWSSAPIQGRTGWGTCSKLFSDVQWATDQNVYLTSRTCLHICLSSPCYHRGPWRLDRTPRPE